MFNRVSESNLVEVCQRINNYFNKGFHGHTPNLYEIAYMFSTAFIESYHFTNPVMLFSDLPEVGKKSYFNDYDIQFNPVKAKRLGNNKPGDGYKYRGRGLVQITGKINYLKMQQALNINFVKNPDLVCNYEYSVPIMIYGMKEGAFTGDLIDGAFTGKRFSDYINSSSINYLEARKIINGTDKAVIFKNNAEIIQTWLEETSPNIPKYFQ